MLGEPVFLQTSPLCLNTEGAGPPSTPFGRVAASEGCKEEMARGQGREAGTLLTVTGPVTALLVTGTHEGGDPG